MKLTTWGLTCKLKLQIRCIDTQNSFGVFQCQRMNPITCIELTHPKKISRDKLQPWMLFLSVTALFRYHVCRVHSASRWVLGSGVPTVSRAVLGSSRRKNRVGGSLFLTYTVHCWNLKRQQKIQRRV